MLAISISKQSDVFLGDTEHHKPFFRIEHLSSLTDAIKEFLKVGFPVSCMLNTDLDAGEITFSPLYVAVHRFGHTECPIRCYYSQDTYGEIKKLINDIRDQPEFGRCAKCVKKAIDEIDELWEDIFGE